MEADTKSIANSRRLGMAPYVLAVYYLHIGSARTKSNDRRRSGEVGNFVSATIPPTYIAEMTNGFQARPRARRWKRIYARTRDNDFAAGGKIEVTIPMIAVSIARRSGVDGVVVSPRY